MPEYRRMRVPGGCYFLTLNLLLRRSTVLVDHVDHLRDALRRVKAEHPFHIDAIVVLPDHLHALVTLPPGDDDYATRVALIKARFSRSLPEGEPVSRSRGRKRERGVWQRRYWEHTIRDDTDFTAHVDYIHFNPVKHGLASRPVDWQWSSFHRYVAAGILAADWGTAGTQRDANWG